MNRKLLAILFFLLPTTSFTQPGSLEALEGQIVEYLYSKDQPNIDRHSEYIVLYLTISDLGQVERINCMSDETQRDSTWLLIKKMTPEHLRNWKGKQFAGKLIIFPLYSMSLFGKQNYIDVMQGGGMFTMEQCGIKGNFDFTIAPRILYTPPYKGRWPGCGSMNLSNVQESDYQDIYLAALHDYYKDKKQNIVINSITNNYDLTRKKFSELAQFGDIRNIYFGWLNNNNIDPYWNYIFTVLDSLKWHATEKHIPQMSSKPYWISVVHPDTLKTIYEQSGPMGVEARFGYHDKVSFSDIVFCGNHAVISMSRYSGGFDGEGMIMLLIKQNNTWIVQARIGTWIA